MTDLLPCPFCGYEAQPMWNECQANFSMAECTSCGACAHHQKWNRRASLKTELWREHSVILNSILWRMGERLGLTRDLEELMVDPVSLADQFFSATAPIAGDRK